MNATSIFQVKDGKLIDLSCNEEIKDLDAIRSATRISLDHWWNTKTITIDGSIYPMENGFNNLCLTIAIGSSIDASLVDINDKTVIIAADTVKTFSQAFQSQLLEAMRYWDETIKLIPIATKPQLIEVFSRI